MDRNLRVPAILVSLTLIACPLAGCSQGQGGGAGTGAASPAAPEPPSAESFDAPERSEEAAGVLSAVTGGGGGFIARVTNGGYQDRREWRLVSETQTHSFFSSSGGSNSERCEYSYDGQGRVVGCVRYDGDEVEREDRWEYDGNTTTRVTTDYGEDPEGVLTRVITEGKDGGGSVETTYDESGSVAQTLEATREEGSEGHTVTRARRDASGAVDYTQVNRYDAGGNLVSSASYDGEPSDATLESVSSCAYDGQGRRTEVLSEYPGYEYGSASGETHYAYASDGSSVALDVEGLTNGYGADAVTFTVEDANGLVLRRSRNLSAGEPSVVAPTNYYATYDEEGNPTLAVSECGNSIASKCSFRYDGNGNLVSVAEAEFDGGELSAVTYYAFQYENALTGERTEAPSTDEIQVPELTGEDAELALNRYGDGPLDRVVYGEGQWQVDLEPDEFGSRTLVIDRMSVAGQPLILACVAREGGTAIENESVGYYETMPSGEVLLVTYTGTRLSLSDATEGSARVRGTLDDGTEVDATAMWVPRY